MPLPGIHFLGSVFTCWRCLQLLGYVRHQIRALTVRGEYAFAWHDSSWHRHRYRSAACAFSILPLSSSLPAAVTLVVHSSKLQVDLRNNEKMQTQQRWVASQVKVVGSAKSSTSTKHPSRSILMVAESWKARRTHQGVLQRLNLKMDFARSVLYRTSIENHAGRVPFFCAR